jgi:uncharacterized protein (UPF0261 family)
MTRPCIVLLGCFDTKGEVYAYLRECVAEQGETVLTINTGIMGTTSLFAVDIEAGEVALQAGHTLEALRLDRDRGKAIDIMGQGAARILATLTAEGRLKGVISMGGGGGTYIALTAMQEVPLGVPKFCLTTLAAKDLSRMMGHKDIVLMPSVVDVAGLNSIIRPLIAQAAAALCAMASVEKPEKVNNSKRIAISMFGNTTACVDHCTELLKQERYEVMAFHANGVGGLTMEALIREGCFEAVLDVTTTELADDLCEGVCSAGPDRLTAATDVGIPQVVVPGCMDMVNFAQPDTVPVRFQDREMYSWAPNVTLMRTNEAENRELGKILIRKLSTATAPVAVLLPLRGLSQIDSPGGVFYRPDTDRALFESIETHAPATMKVLKADAHINDRAFAELLVKTLLELTRSHQNTAQGLQAHKNPIEQISHKS